MNAAYTGPLCDNEDMQLGLSGKTAVVTGASRGIGRAIARILCAEGARVMLSARDEADLMRAASACAAAGSSDMFAGDAAYYAGDLNDPKTAEGLIAYTERKLGAVDVLVVNTGGPPGGMAGELGEQSWRDAAELLFYPAVRLAQAVLPMMRARKWGRILFITSISVKEPVENLALSNALRAAVTGFAKTLAREVAADGVTVNTLGPGYTATERLKNLLEENARRLNVNPRELKERLLDQIPAARLAKPDEIAAVAAFLVSEPAAYLTGQALMVDGGYSHGLL